jgi:cobalt/nickel transport system ATP-binding protein
MLRINELSVEYPDGKIAADNVSFTLGRGENAALIGANGAGKTTILLAIVGVLPAKSGDIRVGETSLGRKTLHEIRSRVGLVFQNPDDQLFMPNIYEDIAFGPRSFGCDMTETDERVDRIMRQLGIEHLRSRSPLKLSGGEKRLCAIATALATEPEFLLFDEPTAFLDPRTRRSLAAAFEDLPQGKLIATHDLAFAEATCSRVLLLKEGKLIADESSKLLREAAKLEAAGL